MPRWDKTRDYYADLELSPNATTEEIKKQFRKLALKYHPDRNPGRETEMNSIFQTIQSAHEILIDATLRRQYDDARRASASRFPKSSGVRGNPWQDIGKQYPPPPTRHATQASPNKPRSGAQRYTSFTSNMPRTPRPSARDDPQFRKSNADAWEGMRPSSSRREPPPTPGRAPTSAARDTKATDSESIPKTAYQQQKAQASFGSRRTGFVPRSPGQADEPPVTSKNYFTTRTHSNLFNGATPDAEPAEPAEPRAPIDPLAQFREKVWDERQSMPYHSPGGEKTSLFDDAPGVGRTRSTRSPRVPGAFPQSRARSSSTPRSSSNDGGSEDSVKFNKGANPSTKEQTPNGSHIPHMRPGGWFTPTTEPDVTWSTTSETPTAKDTSKAGPSSTQAPNSNGPSVYATPFITPLSFLKSGYHSTLGNAGCMKDHASQTAGGACHAPSSGPQSPSSGGAGPKLNPSLLPVEENQRTALDSLINNRSQFGQTPGSAFLNGNNGSKHVPASNNKREKTKSGADHESSSFTFPPGHPMPSQGPNLTRHSADSINTRFVDDEFPDDLKFSAGTTSASDSQTPTKTQPRSRSRITRRQVPKSRQTETDHAPPVQGAFSNGNAAGVFSAGEWSDKIGPRHFEPQPPPRSTSSSPSRRANGKKSKPVKMTAGTAGLVDEENEGWQESYQTPWGSTDTATAMDIDSPPPPEKANDTPKVPQTNGARKIPVEPHREEWRAGDVNGVRNKSASPTPEGNSAKGPFAQPAAPEAASIPTANPFVAQHGGSEDTDEFRTTFSDFKKVEPFADPAPRGLKDFEDLKSTLPFQSKPSENIPLEKEQSHKFVNLAFPTPPVAPRLPQAVLSAGVRPNQVQFRKYAQDFYQYMDKWESFNTRIMAHFSTRQEDFKLRRQQRGAAWLDTTIGGSDTVQEYLKELEQDQAIRQQWVHAHADHQTRLREFMMFRDQVK